MGIDDILSQDEVDAFIGDGAEEKSDGKLDLPTRVELDMGGAFLEDLKAMMDGYHAPLVEAIRYPVTLKIASKELGDIFRRFLDEIKRSQEVMPDWPDSPYRASILVYEEARKLMGDVSIASHNDAEAVRARAFQAAALLIRFIYHLPAGEEKETTK